MFKNFFKSKTKQDIIAIKKKHNAFVRQTNKRFAKIEQQLKTMVQLITILDKRLSNGKQKPASVPTVTSNETTQEDSDKAKPLTNKDPRYMSLSEIAELNKNQ